MANLELSFVLVILACHCYLTSGVIHLPTFTWDAKHPLFKCEDPIIRVPISAQLDVHCPLESIHNYLRNTQFQEVPKIRMVRALDEKHYRKCNITEAKPSLHCGEFKVASGQNCERPELGCTPYYNIFTGQTTSLRQGETYYFIGTDGEGSNKPCVGTNVARPMKFRIYVCTEEETNRGECEPCKTEACYYKECSKKCDDWVSSKIYKDYSGQCYQHQTQRCKNILTATTTSKAKVIIVKCPKPVCGEWKDDGLPKYKNKGCVIPQQRTCTLDGFERMEKQDRKLPECPNISCEDPKLVKTTIIEQPTKSCYKTEKRVCFFIVPSKHGDVKVGYDNFTETNIDCPKPRVVPVTSLPKKQTLSPPHTKKAPQTPKVLARENKESAPTTRQDVDKYIYITIGASIVALIIGIVIGYCLTRCCQVKQEPIEVVRAVEKVIPMEGIGPIMSYDNKNFHLDPVLEDAQSFSMGDIAFIPTTQEFGTTKRQVMVARSVSFYNPELVNASTLGRQKNKNQRSERITERSERQSSSSDDYRPPRTIQESRRNVMRHPSATSKTVLIRNHSDVAERPRSDSDSSVFHLKRPENMESEEV